MKKKTVYIETTSTDPKFNLALEQYVFDCMPKDREYFWLWQNASTIVVGKHQNTAEEINQAYVKEHGIRVVRRLSGGGAVYHDLGNVNFTFIADAKNLETLNLRAFCMPVVQTLKKIGIQAEVSGRNDISIAGKKFSGNSQYIKNGRIMHHGTLMFDSNLAVMEKALQVSADKYTSKGFASVRSRVTNIKPYIPEEMDIQQFKEILRTYMIQGSDVECYRLTLADIKAVCQIRRERYDTWEWNYGASPDYSVQKKRRIGGCGQLDIRMNVQKGKITAFESFGDYFGKGATQELKGRLLGCPLESMALRERLQGFALDTCYSGLTVSVFIKLLTE